MPRVRTLSVPECQYRDKQRYLCMRVSERGRSLGLPPRARGGRTGRAVGGGAWARIGCHGALTHAPWLRPNRPPPFPSSSMPPTPAEISGVQSGSGLFHWSADACRGSGSVDCILRSAACLLDRLTLGTAPHADVACTTGCMEWYRSRASAHGVRGLFGAPSEGRPKARILSGITSKH